MLTATKNKKAKHTANKAVSESPETVLILRTCDAEMKSHGGFVWPKSGRVEAPDWRPTKGCGNGLHGFLWGEGTGSLCSWDEKANWLVAEVDAGTVIDLEGKVKFPRANVMFCGDRKGATEYIRDHGATGKSIIGGWSAAGDRGTATAGDRGIIVCRWWDIAANRYRLTVGYPGEGGIVAGKKYRCDEAGKLIEA